MSDIQWAEVRRRIYRSLPFVLVLLSAAGVVVTEEVWAAAIGLVGMWLLPSPIDVSRETFPSDVSRETLRENVSRETFPEYVEHFSGPVPLSCGQMHGSAEPHVPGCEGWFSASG